MISVIMLTYNREALVSRAVESILAQTYRDFEFIIVDNGSTDRSGAIADEYAARDRRIRVIHRERGSIGAGRNTGLDAARGDYIAFIDDDDYCEPDYLNYLYDLAKQLNADIAVCGSWREIGGAREPKYVFDGIYTYDGETSVVEMLKREKFNSANPTKLFSTQLFDDLRYCETGKYDDIGFMYRAFAQARRVVLSGRPCYTFMRHTDNNSLGTVQGEDPPSPEQISEYLYAFAKRTRWLTQRFPLTADYWHYTELSYMLSMYDKTDDEGMRKRLMALLRYNKVAFLASKRYYTSRDRQLIKKYKGELI